MPGLNPILKEIIWLIVKLVLEGMSREKAITTVAKERGLDAEKLRRKFL